MPSFIIEYRDVILYAVGLLTILTIFLPFSPMTIDLLMLPRAAQITIYRYRRLLWALGILCFGLLTARAGLGLVGQSGWAAETAVMIWAGGLLGEANPVWLTTSAITIGMLAFMFWSGYVPYVMTPPRNPRLLDVAEADRLIGADDVMLGLINGGETRAYPRDWIARPHYFTDTVGGTPFTISYCILCNSGMAFKSELRGRPLNLMCVTAYNNNIIYLDTDGGNYIQQLDGKVFFGPDAGETLEPHPVVLASWAEWKKLHPDTKLYFAPPATLRDKMVALMLRMMIPISRLSQRRKPWHRIRGKLDDRLPAMSFVLGVEINGETATYPLSALQKVSVYNDTVGGEPIVVFYDKQRDIGQVFSRQVDKSTLTFSELSDGNADGLARDSETGTLWDLAGRASDGELADQSLRAIAHYNKLFWFSWALFKPKTSVRMET